nr:hypothetical protein [Cupriavidus gilardii]
MTYILNTVSFSMATLALIIGLLAIVVDSLLGRKSMTFYWDMCVGGFLLALLCAGSVVVYGTFPPVNGWSFAGGAATTVIFINCVAVLRSLWRRRRLAHDGQGN